MAALQGRRLGAVASGSWPDVEEAEPASRPGVVDVPPASMPGAGCLVRPRRGSGVDDSRQRAWHEDSNYHGEVLRRTEVRRGGFRHEGARCRGVEGGFQRSVLECRGGHGAQDDADGEVPGWGDAALDEGRRRRHEQGRFTGEFLGAIVLTFGWLRPQGLPLFVVLVQIQTGERAVRADNMLKEI